jgi:CelD/BcsL family acetyltransferase involved in cellulose biosynthesis
MQTLPYLESPLDVEILDEPSRVARLAAEWGALFARCRFRTPFQSPQWLLAWIETFTPLRLRVVVVRNQDRLLGVAPLLIYRRGAERLLAFAGGGVSDYLDVLSEPGQESTVVAAVFSAILEDPGWSTLELTDLAPNSVLLRSAALRQLASTHDTTSVLVLPSELGELLQCFSKRQRANLRNARSRLERQGGGAVECARPETAQEFLEDLFRLHTRRWSDKGQPGVLDDDRLRAFHRMVVPGLIASGRLHLYRLRVAAGTAAVIYSLFDANTVYCYLQGFDPGFGFFSPGTLLMFSVIEDAIASGMRSFDFLRGQEAYKQHWRAESRSTYRLSLEREHLRSLSNAAQYKAA